MFLRMFFRMCFLMFVVCGGFLCVFHPLGAAEVGTTRLADDRIAVTIDGMFFAEYRTDFNGCPIIWPIVGPSGKEMTRQYPMRDALPSEAKDHPHHRGLWFNHGDVNGVDFWAVGKGKGVIRHREFITVQSGGNEAVIVTTNDWLDPKDDSVLCSDIRTFRFGTCDTTKSSSNTETAADRYVDVTITVTAKQETVVFGDTKEGSFAVRVPGTVDGDAKKRNPQWGGTIMNAEGVKDNSAWAKRSGWVDYFGPVDGETVGIAILEHPSSFRSPTYWHVRTYGLFAANPFGVNDFDNLQIKETAKKPGNLTLKNGESFTLRYRVIFHTGDTETAKIAEEFQKYTNSPVGTSEW